MFIKSKVESGAWRHSEIASIEVIPFNRNIWQVWVSLHGISGANLYDRCDTKDDALASRDALIAKIEALDAGGLIDEDGRTWTPMLGVTIT